MATYSFIDTVGTGVFAGETVQLGYGAGTAEEGISIAMDEDKTITVTGSDGTLMHSLAASNTGMVTIRLLKISPQNQRLQNIYNRTRLVAALWGANHLSFHNITTGDQIELTQAAFVKTPDNNYAKEGNILEWTFRGVLSITYGRGAPA